MSEIGSPVSRVDGPAKVRGEARYAAEFAPDGLVYAAIVRQHSSPPAGSPDARQRAPQDSAPGVLAVLTQLNADPAVSRSRPSGRRWTGVWREAPRAAERRRSSSAASRSR